MTNLDIDPKWLLVATAGSALMVGGAFGYRAYRRAARRRSLIARLDRVSFQAVHQVLVPDGMGGFIHVDHVLLTPQGVLILDTRRVAGLIFGGDQMSEWTVLGRGRRHTFDNPQPALYDRIAAVKALVDDVAVEGRLVFSNVGKFTKGMPKNVLMMDSIEVQFPAVDRSLKGSAAYAGMLEAWNRLMPQLRASPHQFTNL